jgi:hypothetical protein
MSAGSRYATGKRGSYSPVESFLYTRPAVYYSVIALTLLLLAGASFYALRRWRARRRGK